MIRTHISSSVYTGWRQLASEHVLPLLVFTLVAGVLTWPLVLHLGTAFPSEPGEGAQDLWEKMWNLWWLEEGAHVPIVVSPRVGITPQEAKNVAADRSLTVGVWSMEIEAR
jgi:hypothetical protein